MPADNHLKFSFIKKILKFFFFKESVKGSPAPVESYRVRMFTWLAFPWALPPVITQHSSILLGSLLSI